MVGEVKGIEMMGVLIAGRGAKERGDRRLEVKVDSKLTTLAGLHVAMLFEWCVQAFPSGHVGPPATAGKKRRFGKGLHKRRRWHGRSSSQEVEVCLVHVMYSACVDRL